MDFVKLIIYNIYFFIFIVFDFLISNCYRDFGNKNGVSPEAIYYLGLLFGIVNGLSRFMINLAFKS